MKNIYYSSLMLVLLLFMLCFILTACNEIYITFNPDGGSIVSGESTAVYKEKDEMAVTAPEVSREGYVFVGWDKEFDKPETDITVNALWDKLYTITFDAIPDKEDDNTTQLKTSSEKVTYPADPTREGYVFDGWDKHIVNVSEDTTVTAKWKKLYTVMFNLSGGTTNETELLSQIIVEGGSAKAPKAEKPLMAPVVWDKDFTNVTSDIEVTAKWERRELSSTEIAELVSPATVEVNTYRRNGVEWNVGSGFFIDDSGSIVTNYRVIEDSYDIKVKLPDGLICDVAEVVAFDKKLDLAILRIDRATPSYLEFSTGELEKGETVYSIGSSSGYIGTFTSGIITTVKRELNDKNYIQTSVPFSPGNSGSPLLNSKGFVIGVVTIYEPEGQNLNFSIPVSFVSDLKDNRMTLRNWFDQYVALQWWLFEKIVDEKNKSINNSFQKIKNGDTVNGSYAGVGDIDQYYFDTTDINLNCGFNHPIDMYALYYSKDKNFFLNSEIKVTVHVFTFVSGTTSTVTTPLLKINEYTTYSYKDGYLMCIGIYDIYQTNVYQKSSSYMLTVMVSNKGIESGEYSIFIMATANTDMRKTES